MSVCMTVCHWLCSSSLCGCFTAPHASFGRHKAEICTDRIPGECYLCLPGHSQTWRIGYCRRGERIAFSYLISQKYTGESAHLDILRAGEELSITVPLDRPHPLVPIHLDDKQPSYLVVAGRIVSKGSSSLHVLERACWLSPSFLRMKGFDIVSKIS